MLVNKPYINIYNKTGGLITQFLYGEAVEVLSETCQYGTLLKSKWDGYEGFGDIDYLVEGKAPTHFINVITAPVFKSADLKSGHIANLSLNSEVSIIETSGDYSNVGIGWVYNKHIGKIDNFIPSDNDFFGGLAKSFESIPYVWGGKTSAGLDCSGLIQMVFRASGVNIPRDTSEQCKMDWQKIELNDLQSGDLVFWDGHIGIMYNNTDIIHANAHWMMVRCEPLTDVIKYIKDKENKDITTVLRYNNDR